jgi:hypothetical protein
VERPERQPLHAECQADDHDDRQDENQRTRQLHEQQHGVAADHHQFAMREVDQPHDAEDQANAERHEGVQAPDIERIDRVLERQRHRLELYC